MRRKLRKTNGYLPKKRLEALHEKVTKRFEAAMLKHKQEKAMKILTLENDCTLSYLFTERFPEKVQQWKEDGLITDEQEAFYLDYGHVVADLKSKDFGKDFEGLVTLLREYDVIKTFSTYTGESSKQLRTIITLFHKHGITGKKHYEHSFYLSNALRSLRFETVELRKAVDWVIANNEVYQLEYDKFVRITPENIWR